ncbi:DUF1428 family protein [Haladaptatus salinisoli]|uniref:DUF1428 family protein n=1 Tax=Haladaptatus salinisoli TaxID=2884876 RepID=UPI001D0A117C|nr:DUF1428 family protein [Haladaptatus salinisoli]
MSQYVDGYVLPIPSDKIEAYREMADEAGKTWMGGATSSYTTPTEERPCRNC